MRRLMLAVLVGALVLTFGPAWVRTGAHDALDRLRALTGAQEALPTGVTKMHTEAAKASATDYQFMEVGGDKRPARWDPCEPIHYVVNVKRASAGALSDTKAAFKKVSAATGLRFVFDGTITRTPTSNWSELSWPKREYPPLVVAWLKPGQSDLLTDKTESGRGGSDYLIEGKRLRSITGTVVLNSNQNSLYKAGFGSGAHRGTLLLHEIGHAVGLDHARKEGQIMYPSIGDTTPAGYAAGDLAGLKKLGASQGCLP